MIVPNAFLSGLIWFALIVVTLYLARDPAHRMLRSAALGLYAGFRLAARAVMRAHAQLTARNREVLLAAGREATERHLVQEFDRITTAVTRDLSEYPALARTMGETVAKIEQDYGESTSVPPSVPGWDKAVAAVAAIPSNGDPMVGKTLEVVHKSFVDSQKKAEEDYRDATRGRHKILSRMLPHWRQLNKSLGEADKRVKRLLERSKTVDAHIEAYEGMVQGTEQAERALASSAMRQFFTASLILAIAVGGAIINFNLIARPMSEMVGGTSMIGTFRTSEVAALVIILLEIAMGVFLMECFRITRLFPVIGALTDQVRKRMALAAFVILFILAGVEAGLAYMRELLLQDELATSAVLRGEDAALDSQFLWITTVAQMGLGFILPFALVFVAIPLEDFIHSLRSVIGEVTSALLRGLALVLRLLGSGLKNGIGAVIALYDLIIFLPLWVEERIAQRPKTSAIDAADATMLPKAEAPKAIAKRSRPRKEPSLDDGAFDPSATPAE